MFINKTTEIGIFDKSVPDISKEIAAALPNKASFVGSTITLSWKEEAAFDRLHGMHWPAIVGMHVKKHLGLDSKQISANVEFPDEKTVLVTFVPTERKDSDTRPA